MSVFSILIATSRTTRIVLAIAGTALLSGCVSAPPTAYHWGGYEKSVYDYLRADGTSPGERITVMESEIEKAKAESKPLPPGFRAHLGLLYGETGRVAEMREQLEIERADYPESATYVDFVLSNMNETPTNAQP